MFGLYKKEYEQQHEYMLRVRIVLCVLYASTFWTACGRQLVKLY